MKKLKFIFLIIVLACKSQAQRLEIYGFVHDKLDSSLISNAKVILYNEKDSVIEKTSTDDAGKFIFKRVDNGVYKINVDKEGYAHETMKNLKVSSLPNCPLRIYMKKKKTH